MVKRAWGVAHLRLCHEFYRERPLLHAGDRLLTFRLFLAYWTVEPHQKPRFADRSQVLKKSIRNAPCYGWDYSDTLTRTGCFDDTDRGYHQRYSGKAGDGTADYPFAGHLGDRKRHSFTL